MSTYHASLPIRGNVLLQNDLDAKVCFFVAPWKNYTSTNARRGIQLLEVWCGTGTYNDMRSYIRGPQLIQVVLSCPATNYILERGSSRHTKMNGVLRNFADPDK